jgi:hypothetical protein
VPFAGCHHQPGPALAVLDEQVLAVQARDFALQGTALLDGEDGRVVYGAMRDAQLVQQGKKLVGRSGHVDPAGSRLDRADVQAI